MRNKQFRFFFKFVSRERKKEILSKKKSALDIRSRISAYTSAYIRAPIPRVRISLSSPGAFFPTGIRIDIKRNNIVGI